MDPEPASGGADTAKQDALRDYQRALQLHKDNDGKVRYHTSRLT